MEKKQLLKPIDTLSLILMITGMLKTAAIVMGAVLVQWAQKQKNLAERRMHVAETDLAIRERQDEIKDPDADSVINGFLDSK